MLNQTSTRKGDGSKIEEGGTEAMGKKQSFWFFFTCIGHLYTKSNLHCWNATNYSKKPGIPTLSRESEAISQEALRPGALSGVPIFLVPTLGTCIHFPKFVRTKKKICNTLTTTNE